MAFNFPNNPSMNQQYLGPNGVTYTFDGTKWNGSAIGGPSSGMTLIGTLTTTSGTTQTLSGLSLTGYTSLFIVIDGVSHDAAGVNRRIQIAGQSLTGARGPNAIFSGTIHVMLSSGYAVGLLEALGNTGNFLVATGYSTETTSISFTWDGSGNFDSGTIMVYGVN